MNKERNRWLWIGFLPTILVLGFGAMKFGEAWRSKSGYSQVEVYLYIFVAILVLIWLFYSLQNYDKENQK